MDPVTRARINAQMRETLAELISRQVKDPRVETVTVTAVEVTPDLSYATVLWSVLGGDETKRVADRGLRNAAGFLRREIGRRLRLRNAPQLRFAFDDSLERGQRIETLLREWHDESDARRPPDAGGEEDAGD